MNKFINKFKIPDPFFPNSLEYVVSVSSLLVCQPRKLSVVGAPCARSMGSYFPGPHSLEASNNLHFPRRPRTVLMHPGGGSPEDGRRKGQSHFS